MVAPELMSEVLPSLRAGWERGGRSPESFDIAPTVTVRVDDDLDAARDAMRHYIGLYVGGMGSRSKNFYNALATSYGFGDAAREIQDLYLEGKKDEALAAIPAELIDAVSLAGPADRIRDRLNAFRDAGVGTLVLSPMAVTVEERISQLRQLADLAS
jgi:alkanesulfonate monooxygenase SsuD/methylene tetrahydromethanopterin reductase-like flavin-dependent oxidoreductase (luciferase family)